MNKDNFERGMNAEQEFMQTMLKCNRIKNIAKMPPYVDMIYKQDFLIEYESIFKNIVSFTVDVKSPYEKDPRFVNINHTSRDGSIGTLPLSRADFIAVKGKYDDLGKLPEPIDVWYFIMKENIWNAITADMYHESNTDQSAWYQVPIYGEQYGTMSGRGLAVKRSMLIDMDGNVLESRISDYTRLLR